MLLLDRSRDDVPDIAGNRPVLAFRGALDGRPQTGIDRYRKLFATLILIRHALFLKSSDAIVGRMRFADNAPASNATHLGFLGKVRPKI
jgi:hypothetical protein